MKRKNKNKKNECKHSPHRLHSWYATDGTLCVCCNDCGKVLKGGV